MQIIETIDVDVKHAVKKDLENFKEFIEDRGLETGAWRGDIDRGGVSL
jgi:hypothetical protein